MSDRQRALGAFRELFGRCATDVLKYPERNPALGAEIQRVGKRVARKGWSENADELASVMMDALAGVLLERAKLMAAEHGRPMPTHVELPDGSRIPIDPEASDA